MPLLLKQCPRQSIIDFETFYNEMQNIKFDLKFTGLNLCSCGYCNRITKIRGYIYYHEAFGEALKQMKPNDLYHYSFKLSPYSNKVQAYTNSKPIKQLSFQNSFLQKQISGKTYQLVSMSQTIYNGLRLMHDVSGIYGNLDEFAERMNLFISLSPELRKYRFVVISVKLTFIKKPSKQTRA